jgi:hypothetical protein
VVTEDFLQPDAVFNGTIDDRYYSYIDDDFLSEMHTAALNGTLNKLDNSDCMGRYATNFVSQSRNVLLVTTDTNDTNQFLQYGTWIADQEIPYWWLCGNQWNPYPYSEHEPVCTLSTARANVDSWSVLTHPITYCMVQDVEELCQLRFSLTIMIIVILANATKATIMILTYLKLRTPTLVTMGDAISSFLDDPDPTTAGACLATKADVQKDRLVWKDEGGKRWVPKREYWFRAASVKRWLTCNFL